MEDRPASHIRWFNSARNDPGWNTSQLCSTHKICGGGDESYVLSFSDSGGGETRSKCSACSEWGTWLGVGEREDVCLGLRTLAISALLLEVMYSRSGGSTLSKPERVRDRRRSNVCGRWRGRKERRGKRDRRTSSKSRRSRWWWWRSNDTAAVGERLTGHIDIVWPVAYSPDGSHIISGSL